MYLNTAVPTVKAKYYLLTDSELSTVRESVNARLVTQKISRQQVARDGAHFKAISRLRYKLRDAGVPPGKICIIFA